MIEGRTAQRREPQRAARRGVPDRADVAPPRVASKGAAGERRAGRRRDGTADGRDGASVPDRVEMQKLAVRERRAIRPVERTRARDRIRETNARRALLGAPGRIDERRAIRREGERRRRGLAPEIAPAGITSSENGGRRGTEDVLDPRREVRQRARVARGEYRRARDRIRTRRERPQPDLPFGGDLANDGVIDRADAAAGDETPEARGGAREDNRTRTRRSRCFLDAIREECHDGKPSKVLRT